ncbi:MAG: CopG family antitoxin [Gammaproteobacteria bacterium]
MKNKKITPFDAEEKMLMQSVENDEWTSVKNSSILKKKLQSMAKKHLKKNARINIRIQESDLTMLKQQAANLGIPYQTLIASVLHRYANGTLPLHTGF